MVKLDHILWYQNKRNTKCSIKLTIKCSTTMNITNISNPNKVYDSPSLFCTSSSFMCHHSSVDVVTTATLTLVVTLEQENRWCCCSKLVTLGYFTFSSKVILSWLTLHMPQLMTFNFAKDQITPKDISSIVI